MTWLLAVLAALAAAVASFFRLRLARRDRELEQARDSLAMERAIARDALQTNRQLEAALKSEELARQVPPPVVLPEDAPREKVDSSVRASLYHIRRLSMSRAKENHNLPGTDKRLHGADPSAPGRPGRPGGKKP